MGNDIEDLTERIRVYMGWEKDSPHYYRTVDLYNIFFDCLKEQVTKEESLLTVDQVNCVTQRQWLNMWGNLIKGATSIMSFPSWVQILPKQIFSMIDKEDNGFITERELREFYQKFFKVTDDLEEQAKYGYAALTANGDYKLTYDLFTMSFSNFLLGKTETGPGKYIFGVFGHKEFSESFKVNMMTEEKIEAV